VTKRAVIISTKQTGIEDLVGEVSSYVVSRGARVLYRKVSAAPIFVYFGGEVRNADRI